MQPTAELLDKAGSPGKEPGDSPAGKVLQSLVLGQEPVEAARVGRAAARSPGGAVRPHSLTHPSRGHQLPVAILGEMVKKHLDRRRGIK